MILNNAGKRVKEIRKERRMTQEQFAALVNISKTDVRNIECGHKFTIEQIDNICRKTGVRVEYIMYGKAEYSENFDFLDDLSTAQINISLEILKRISDFIKSPNGNAMLIDELMRRQHD